MRISRLLPSVSRKKTQAEVAKEQKLKKMEDSLLLDYKRFHDSLMKYENDAENIDEMFFIPNRREIIANISENISHYNSDLKSRFVSAKKVLQLPIQTTDLESNILHTILEENEQLKERLNAVKQEQKQALPDVSQAELWLANNIAKESEINKRRAVIENKKKKMEQDERQLEDAKKKLDDELHQKRVHEQIKANEKLHESKMKEKRLYVDIMELQINERKQRFEVSKEEFEMMKAKNEMEIKQMEEKLNTKRIEAEHNKSLMNELKQYPAMMESLLVKLNDAELEIANLKHLHGKENKKNQALYDDEKALENKRMLLDEKLQIVIGKEKLIEAKKKRVDAITESTIIIKEETANAYKALVDLERKCNEYEQEINTILEQCNKLQEEKDMYIHNHSHANKVTEELVQLLDSQNSASPEYD